jgi:hypothetical protein
MLEFLRYQVWQFVGALFGLAALIVSLVIYHRQKQQKAFSYEIIANTPLLSVSEEIRSRVQISLDGKVVEDVRYLLVRCKNTGNIPILASDFVEAISIALQQQAAIISAEIIETIPKNLRSELEVSQEGNVVTLQPVLFNASDTVVVKLLASQANGPVEVTGRIVGVRQVQAITPFDERRLNWKVNILWGIAVAMVLGIFGILVSSNVMLSLVVAILGGFVMFASSTATDLISGRPTYFGRK